MTTRQDIADRPHAKTPQAYIVPAHKYEHERKTDWRDTASCRGINPELWFPKGDSGPWLAVIEDAKSICRRCPSKASCLQFALDGGDTNGIFGGLTERERVSLRRAANRRALTPEAVAARAEDARQVQEPRTMQSIFDAGTTRLHGGHLAWTGTQKISFKGQPFTPKQFVFTLDRGRAPDGRVTAECGISECVLPEHLKDQQERGICGTRNGYQRHLAAGEEPCTPCRKANTDADRRLRNTGTTKIVAVAA